MDCGKGKSGSDSKQQAKTNSPLDSLLPRLERYLKEQLDPITSFIRGSLADDLTAIKEKVSNIDDISKSLEFLSDEYDRLNKLCESNQEKLAEISADNVRLLERNKTLEYKINQMEQRQRKNNVEIQQVPESKTENVLEIAKKIGEVVGFPLKADDIHVCHRVQHQSGTVNRPRNIVVELPSSRLRDQFLQSVKAFNKKNPENKLNTSHLGPKYERKNPVFVVEHLSPYFKEIHAKARLLAKEKNIKYVWISGGKVLTRKNDSAPIIEIRNLESLKKL
jgi:hypothetical protein